MTDPRNQSLWKSSETANSPSQGTTSVVSPQELRDKFSSTRNATAALLKDTKWPLETNGAARSFLQVINSLPELPTEIIAVEDAVEEFLQVLEAAHASVKGASDKYGTKERGFGDGLRHKISSLRSHKCSTILQTYQDNIEKSLVMLRNRLDRAKTSGITGGLMVVPGPQNNPAVPADKAEVSGPFPAPTAKSDEQTTISRNPSSHQASVPDGSSDLPESQQRGSPIREGALVAARKTFKTVETVSGVIPGVGGFVGVAAKVGLAFVDMIETMDKNEDVAKELASHTSKLSTYLEHFKKKSAADKGDELVTHIDNLHKELECVQKKVDLWNSTGRLKKAFLSTNHAEELKGHRDVVQTTLEEMQLLASLKTADLVTEIKNTELRAERRRLLDRLGDGSYGARGNSIEEVVCLPGTRAAILDRIGEWIKDISVSTERVLWIRGMAGRGKSTIASTVAHQWSSKGSCAIFHFRRGQNALDGQFICALARQLGKSLVPEVKNAILECIEENEDIAKERLDQQFKTLFVGSFGKLQGHPYPIVIIVDALDECDNVTDAVRFVRLIDQHSSLLPANVKFLLTCRPEAPLLVALEPRQWCAEDLDSMPHVSDKIARFIEHACAQIRDDHSLPKDWPSSADVGGIVRMSQGLFQWARTAITYSGGQQVVTNPRAPNSILNSSPKFDLYVL